MRKIVPLLACVLILASLCVPVEAASGYDPSVSLNSTYSHPLGWDTMVIDVDDAALFCVDHPYFSVASSDISSAQFATATIEYWSPYEDTLFEEPTVCFEDMSLSDLNTGSSSVSGYYNIGWSMDGLGMSSSTFFDFGFYGDTLLYCNPVMAYSACRVCKIMVPAYCTLSYTVSLDLLICDASVQSNGNVISELTPVSLISETVVIENSSAEEIYVSYLPEPSVFFGDYYLDLKTSECFIVGSSWTGHMQYSETMDSRHVVMSTPVVSDLTDYSSLLSEAWVDNATYIVQEVAVDADFTTWLGTAIRGVWVAEIVPGFSLGALFGACFGVWFLFVVLKLFK